MTKKWIVAFAFLAATIQLRRKREQTVISVMAASFPGKGPTIPAAGSVH